MAEDEKTTSADIARKIEPPIPVSCDYGGPIVSGRSWPGEGFTNATDAPKNPAEWFLVWLTRLFGNSRK